VGFADHFFALASQFASERNGQKSIFIGGDPVGPFVGRVQLLALQVAVHPFRAYHHSLCSQMVHNSWLAIALLADDRNGNV